MGWLDAYGATSRNEMKWNRKGQNLNKTNIGTWTTHKPPNLVIKQ